MWKLRISIILGLGTEWTSSTMRNGLCTRVKMSRPLCYLIQASAPCMVYLPPFGLNVGESSIMDSSGQHHFQMIWTENSQFRQIRKFDIGSLQDYDGIATQSQVRISRRLGCPLSKQICMYMCVCMHVANIRIFFIHIYIYMDHIQLNHIIFYYIILG